MNFQWTEENVATLQRMWGEGFSDAKIAKAIGATSRNAVIGKRSRLGISHKKPTSPGKEKSAPQKRIRRKQKPIPRSLTSDEQEALRQKRLQVEWERNQKRRENQKEERRMDLVVVERKDNDLPPVHFQQVNGAHESLMALHPDQCKWPIGDTQADDFHFCTAKRMPAFKDARGIAHAGSIYCEEHTRLAYNGTVSQGSKRTVDWYEDREKWAKENRDLPLAKRILAILAKRRAA